MLMSYRYHWVMWGSMVVLIGLMLFSITRGTVSLSLMQVLGALKIVDEPVSAMVSRIVTDLRVPRMLLSVLTGAGLAMVGAL
ncbi:iron chelate uptake ABC transporter family permease subunit, partial [Escherichia coli]|nr:iron chelate uptake ABC transporter family permease subunit [Escherichia coli]